MAPQAKKIGPSPGRCRIFLSIFFSYPRKGGGPPKAEKNQNFPISKLITGGGRIVDPGSTIRRTDGYKSGVSEKKIFFSKLNTGGELLKYTYTLFGGNYCLNGQKTKKKKKKKKSLLFQGFLVAETSRKHHH